jgi:hypothetical protein
MENIIIFTGQLRGLYFSQNSFEVIITIDYMAISPLDLPLLENTFYLICLCIYFTQHSG